MITSLTSNSCPFKTVDLFSILCFYFTLFFKFRVKNFFQCNRKNGITRPHLRNFSLCRIQLIAVIIAQENTWTHMVSLPASTRFHSQRGGIPGRYVLIALYVRREMGPSISFSFPAGLGLNHRVALPSVESPISLRVLCTYVLRRHATVVMQSSIAITSLIEVRDTSF